MLFSSYAFIFLFVPATMVGYYAIASRNKPAALAFLMPKSAARPQPSDDGAVA